MYEVNAINATINGKKEFIYNYNKNTINSMTTNPFLNIDINFSSISIAYIEGDENFFEFLNNKLSVVF